MSTYNPYAYRSYISSSKNNNEMKLHKQAVRNSIAKVSIRGKVTITLTLVTLIVMSLFLFSATASTTPGKLPLDGESIIAVGAGDTLWDIAKFHYSDASDIGYIVYLIKDRNQLDSSTITPGQQLILPSI
ncbi:LysM peptidoglycan-binding domain-containing protein [Paenibacillus endoradicis]|uniref:LysM peptidoglycan-binding domain-containing protein n=1 Tax=Paenibacillus endoradicis TaxID=2972487 RepID=UPI002158D86A|nr:LysM peptidoglycan-binding domain-containing protein [Paenibacillus endoradicis]MCR8656857.1 LysM peptidoglycan-binding domain-containing protein [Paenibacillus endoradicis]